MRPRGQASPLCEAAPMLVRFAHIANGIVNPNHSVMRATVMPHVPDRENFKVGSNSVRIVIRLGPLSFERRYNYVAAGAKS